MERGIPARLTPAEGRKFAFPVGLAFLALAGVTWWRGHETLVWVFGTLSGLLLLAGLLIPGRLGPVYRGWMKFAHLISLVTTPIFMGVVYYLVMAPIGLLRRTLGGNPVVQELEGGTYFRSRGEGDRRGDLTRQF